MSTTLDSVVAAEAKDPTPPQAQYLRDMVGTQALANKGIQLVQHGDSVQHGIYYSLG